MIPYALMVGGLMLGGYALAVAVPYVEALWTRRMTTTRTPRDHGSRRVCRTRKPPHHRSTP